MCGFDNRLYTQQTDKVDCWMLRNVWKNKLPYIYLVLMVYSNGSRNTHKHSIN